MVKKYTELVANDVIITGGNIFKVSKARITKRGVVMVDVRQYNRQSGHWSSYEHTLWDVPNKVEVFDSEHSAMAYLLEYVANLHKYLPFFVYGTLRPGHGNYYNYFKGHTIREEHATIENVTIYASGIPFMYEGNEVGHGDVLWVPEEKYSTILKGVDELEGFSILSEWNHYTRKEVTVTMDNGEQVQAWAYYCSDDGPRRGLTKVPNNDYNLYRRGY